MQLRKQPQSGRRRGATAVEMAIVLGLFMMLLLGIFEYGRFLLVMHVANNAARDAARLAVVKTADITNETQVIAEANTRMMGLEKNLQGGAVPYGVEVFTVDDAQLPTIVKKPGSNWNDATFNQFIAVRIKGTYKPIVPILTWMKPSMNVEVTALMNSEAN